MALFGKQDAVKISFQFDDDVLDLYGIKSKDRLIDTLTMIFLDCNDDINCNLAFIKEMKNEGTISSDEASLLVHQTTKIYAEIKYLRDTINEYCEN